jgi:hypothetical protein
VVRVTDPYGRKRTRLLDECIVRCKLTVGFSRLTVRMEALIVLSDYRVLYYLKT